MTPRAPVDGRRVESGAPSGEEPPPVGGGEGAGWRWIAGPAVVLGVALTLPLATLDHPPTFDELYHLLAARSWAADGTFRIAEGSYDRDAPLTALIGRLFRAFGEDPAVARVIPLVSVALLAAALFAWTRRVAGSATAWATAALFCLSPLTLFMAGFIRIYATHALAFFVGAVALREAIGAGGSRRSRLAWGVAAALGLGLAVPMQSTTLIGLLGLGLWIAIDLGGALLRWLGGRPGRQRTALVVVAVVGVAAAVGVGVASGRIQGLVDRFLSASTWSADRDVRFYHWVLLSRFPTLWTLLPVAALLAIVHRGSAAMLSVCLAATGLVLHSLAGMKAERYVFYLMPFVTFVWAVALVAVARPTARLAREVAARILARFGVRSGVVFGQVALLALVVGFLVVANPGFTMAAKMAAGRVAYAELDTPFREAAGRPWEEAIPAVQDALDPGGVLVTTNGLKTLYELGFYDVEFSRTRLSDLGGRGQEFVLDPRTGKPLISTAPSLRRILACRGGVFISPENPWRGLDREVRDLLRESARPVPLPPATGLVAFAWDPAGPPPPEGCPDLGSR